MTGPEFTSCVLPKDYVETSSDAVIVLYLNIWEATDYMLHRKLVCMGNTHPGTGSDGRPRLVLSEELGTTCAIGRVVSFEPPSGKHFPDSIDNDFSFNILLRPDDAIAELSDDPFSNDAWMKKSANERLAAVRRGYQGELITEQPGTPSPREAEGGAHYAGYTSEMFYDSTRRQSGTSVAVPLFKKRYVWFRDGKVNEYPLSQAGGYNVPAFHCECEGTRIRDVFNIADQMPGGGAGCKKHWYTSVLCFLARLLTLPFTLAFVAEAWAKARDGNYHDAMEGNGTLNVGDLVLVRGRWVFDAGHNGYNEMHAVRTIQKIPDSDPKRLQNPPPGSDPAEFKSFYQAWCYQSGLAPADHAPGDRPAGMTPEQSATYDNQQRPEIQYSIHPLVDGCASLEQPLIASVEPNEFNRQFGKAEMVISGSNFAPGATVSLRSPEINVEGVTVQSRTRIIATALIHSDSAIGPRDVIVRNPDGESTTSQRSVFIVDRPIIK